MEEIRNKLQNLQVFKQNEEKMDTVPPYMYQEKIPTSSPPRLSSNSMPPSSLGMLFIMYQKFIYAILLISTDNRNI